MRSKMIPKNKFSVAHVREKAKIVHSNEYSVLKLEPHGKQRKVTIKHKKCNRIKEMVVYGFLAGKGCQFCKGGRPRLSMKEIENRFFAIHDRNEWILGMEVEPYIYPSNGLKQRQFIVTHKNCGTSKAVTTNHFLKHNVGCGVCRFENE